MVVSIYIYIYKLKQLPIIDVVHGSICPFFEVFIILHKNSENIAHLLLETTYAKSSMLRRLLASMQAKMYWYLYAPLILCSGIASLTLHRGGDWIKERERERERELEWVHACLYLYECMCVYMRIYIYMHACTNVCMCLCMYVCMYVCTSIYIYIRMYMYICISISFHMSLHGCVFYISVGKCRFHSRYCSCSVLEFATMKLFFFFVNVSQVIREWKSPSKSKKGWGRGDARERNEQQGGISRWVARLLIDRGRGRAHEICWKRMVWKTSAPE